MKKLKRLEKVRRANRLATLEQKMLKYCEADGDQRESEKEGGNEHPLGALQVPLRLDEITLLKVLFGHAGIHDTYESGEREAPAAQHRKQVYILDVIISHVHIRLLYGQAGVNDGEPVVFTLYKPTAAGLIQRGRSTGKIGHRLAVRGAQLIVEYAVIMFGVCHVD